MNLASLNEIALNAQAFEPLIEEGALISFGQSIGFYEGPGSLFGIGQKVGILAASDYIAQIEQDVAYRETGTGLTITFEQDVNSIASGALISFEQTIASAATVDHLTRNGWDAIITIDGQQVSNNTIIGQIRVERTENAAALAEFTFLPPSGVHNVEAYAGKRVTIDVMIPGSVHRVYTGIIDIPEIDLINKTIRILCTDRRRELINSQLANALSTIGSFSSVIFPDVKDTADELEKRLQTTPASVDFDVYGNYTYTSWYAKSTPDFTLSDSDVYYRQPRVELANRNSILNRVTMSFQHRFERFHHIERNFSWTSPMATDVLKLLRYGYSMTRREDIASAIYAAGWPLKGSITYTPIWPSGWYGVFAWSTVQYTSSNVGKVDSDGDPVLDAIGIQV